MARHTVTKPVSADSAHIWDLLRAFDDVSWIPAASSVRTEGRGPGMRRFISGGAGEVVERLIALDDDARTLVYSIDENNPLPVHRYEATATVANHGGGSTISWTVDFDADDESAAVQGIEAIYGVMASWLEDAASR
jgi:mxaD protein